MLEIWTAAGLVCTSFVTGRGSRPSESSSNVAEKLVGPRKPDESVKKRFGLARLWGWRLMLVLLVGDPILEGDSVALGVMGMRWAETVWLLLLAEGRVIGAAR